MRNPHSYKRVLLLTLILIQGLSLWAQRIEKTKVIDKHFAVDQTVRVEVENKYGNMHINTWAKDSVYLRIEYTIKAKDTKRYNKMDESVDFEFVETSHYVIARTLFLSSGQEMFRDLSSALTSSSASSITVNYEIFVPENAKLHITNKYGNVYTTDLKGDVIFNLGYGTFKGNNFEGHSDITLNNCNASIHKIPVGIITLNYSELLLNEAGSLKLNSRSSEVHVQQIEAINIDGKSDQIRIDECNKVTVTGNFTQFEVDNLTGDLNAKTKYGNLDIYLDENYNGNLLVDSKYTDISLRLFGDKTKLQSEIRHQRSKLVYPSGMTQLEEKQISSNDVIYHSSGTIGNGDGNSKLTFFMESGDLSIFSR